MHSSPSASIASKSRENEDACFYETSFLVDEVGYMNINN